MLSPDGYVSSRKIEGVAVQVLYDRSYAVYKIATSLIDPLLIGGYSSQDLRDILVSLLEDAIVLKRPTVRFENGKAVHLEEFYKTHTASPDAANTLATGDNIAVGAASDVVAELGGNAGNDAADDALGANDVVDEELGGTDPLDSLRDDVTPISVLRGIDPRENLLETGGNAPKSPSYRFNKAKK